MTDQKQTNRIPDFKSRVEMAEWFDTHDMTDYKDEFTPIEVVYDLEKPKQETIVVRLHKGVKEQLAGIAVEPQ